MRPAIAPIHIEMRRTRARNSRPMIERAGPESRALVALLFRQASAIKAVDLTGTGSEAQTQPNDPQPGCVELPIQPCPYEEPHEGRHDQQAGNGEQQTRGSESAVARVFL